MLTHLRIRNFKAWKDTGPIRLAPLTVIFGANSAGKSSLGHLLLALQQTARSTMASMLLAILSGDEALAKRMSKIQPRIANCLPRLIAPVAKAEA